MATYEGFWDPGFPRRAPVPRRPRTQWFTPRDAFTCRIDRTSKEELATVKRNLKAARYPVNEYAEPHACSWILPDYTAIPTWGGRPDKTMEHFEIIHDAGYSSSHGHNANVGAVRKGWIRCVGAGFDNRHTFEFDTRNADAVRNFELIGDAMIGTGATFLIDDTVNGIHCRFNSDDFQEADFRLEKILRQHGVCEPGKKGDEQFGCPENYGQRRIFDY